MKTNFKPLAVDFVRANNCATFVPVELIQRAMEIGAAETLSATTRRLEILREELQARRERNLRG